jgi:hypothetical protein
VLAAIAVAVAVVAAAPLAVILTDIKLWNVVVIISVGDGRL